MNMTRDTKKKEIEEYLTMNLHWELQNIEKIDCLGGMTNSNFVIVMNGEKEGTYVFRSPGEGCSYFVNRIYENFNIHAIQDIGLDAEIVYFNEESGVKITKYLEEAETLNPNTAFSYVRQVAQALKRLHQSQVCFRNNFDVFQEILRYESGIIGDISKVYEDYEKIREKVFRLRDTLEEMGRNLVSCHNDTVPENFVFSKGKIYLIDWEYSGMNELEWDLGAFCLECNFSKKETEELIRVYFEGKETKQNILKIKIYQICQDFLWSLWTILKEEKGEKFGTYGIDRYRRAIQMLKELEYENWR